MSKEKKYYWMVWSRANLTGGSHYNEAVTDRHPFVVMAEVTDKRTIPNTILDNWKEITKEEYELYKSVLKK